MRIQVRVRPNSRTEEVSQEGDSFTVRVKEPAKEGKANLAVIELLAQHFGIPKSQVSIVSGLRSKSKVIVVAEK